MQHSIHVIGRFLSIISSPLTTESVDSICRDVHVQTRCTLCVWTFPYPPPNQHSESPVSSHSPVVRDPRKRRREGEGEGNKRKKSRSEQVEPEVKEEREESEVWTLAVMHILTRQPALDISNHNLHMPYYLE